MGLSRDLKPWVSPSVRLKQLCHLNSLKKTEMPYCNMSKPFIFDIYYPFNEMSCLLHVWCEPECFSVQSSAWQTRAWGNGRVSWGPNASAVEHKRDFSWHDKQLAVVLCLLEWKTWANYHKVSCFLWVFMSEVSRIDSESSLERIFIFDPENMHWSHFRTWALDLLCFRASVVSPPSYSPKSCTVRLDQHPLWGVENKWITKFNTLEFRAQLRTEEGCTSICSINVQPQSLFLTCTKDKWK